MNGKVWDLVPVWAVPVVQYLCNFGGEINVSILIERNCEIEEVSISVLYLGCVFQCHMVVIIWSSTFKTFSCMLLHCLIFFTMLLLFMLLCLTIILFFMIFA